MKDPKLEEIKVSLAELQGKFKEIIANGDMNQEDKYMKQMSNLANYFYQMIDGIRSYVYRIEDRLYTHEHEGHLPKIIGAERMNNALEVLGLDGDYKAEQKVIYASKNNYVIEAECPKIN